MASISYFSPEIEIVRIYDTNTNSARTESLSIALISLSFMQQIETKGIRLKAGSRLLSLSRAFSRNNPRLSFTPRNRDITPRLLFARR